MGLWPSVRLLPDGIPADQNHSIGVDPEDVEPAPEERKNDSAEGGGVSMSCLILLALAYFDGACSALRNSVALDYAGGGAIVVKEKDAQSGRASLLLGQ